MKKLLLLLVLLLPAYAEAATYWVHPTGNNGACTNTTTPQGSGGNAKTTIVAGLACLAAGDTLYIRAGTYNERLSNVTSNIPGGSSWPTATTISGYTGETVLIMPTAQNGNGLLDMRRPSQLGGQVNEWIIWQDLIFDGTNVDGGGILSIGQSHNRMSRVEVRNNGACCSNPVNNAAISIGGDDGGVVVGVEFTHGWVHDNSLTTGTSNGTNAPYGFYDSRSTGTIIEYSDIYRNGGFGIHGYSSVGGGHNSAIYRYNRLWDNQLYAGPPESANIIATSGSGHQVYGNVIWQATSGPQSALNNGIMTGIGGSSGVLIANNTIYNMPRRGIYLTANASGATVVNNIVVNSDTLGTGGPDFINIKDEGSTSPTISTNLCNGTGGTTSCQITGNPLFVNPPTDFKLASTSSPAYNTGTNMSGTFTTGLPEGTVRPQGGGWDLGAYEFVPSGPPPTDDFARAGPGLGANWLSGYTGKSAPTIVSQQVQGSTLLSNAVAVWSTAATYDHSATITLAALSDPSGGDVGVILRASAPTTATYYYVAATILSPSTTYIYKCIAGVCDTIAQDPSVTWAAGDTIKASITGSVISVLRNGAPVFSYTDGSPLVGLYAGLASFAVSSLSTMAADNFIIESLGGTAPTQSTGRIVKIQSGQTLKLGLQ